MTTQTKVATLILLSYAVLKLTFYDSGKLLDSLLIALGLVYLYRYQPPLTKGMPVRAFWLILLAMTITWGMGQLTHPDLIKSTPKYDHLGRHFLFLAFAPWLLGHVRLTLLFLALGGMSVAISPWSLGQGWEEIALGWSGSRVSFGIHNEQHTALVFGSAFLGFLFMGPRLWRGQSQIRAPLVLLWLLVLIWFLFGMMVTQTRTAYIALAVLFGLGLVVFITWLFRQAPHRLESGWLEISWRTWYVLGALGVAWTIVMTTMAFSDVLTRRFGESSLTLAHIFQGQWGQIADDSLGLRIQSWVAAWQWFKDYPLFGVGRNGASIVLENTPWLASSVVSKFGHMHSSFVDIAIRYGLFAFAIYIWLAAWTAQQAYQAWRAGVIPTDFYLFFVSFFIFFTIMNLFESYMFYSTGVYTFTLVMSSLIGFIWKFKFQSKNSARLPT